MKKMLFNLIVIISIIGIIRVNPDNMKTRIVENSMNKDSLQEIKEKGVITVASPLYDIPFYSVNPETNEISGIDADIINEIAKRLGINKVESKETLFSNLLEKLMTDDSINMAAGGIYITPEREKLITFTQPLYKESETVVVQQFSNINFVRDLKDAVVGVEKGTIFEKLAQKWKQNNLIKELVTFQDTSELLTSVNSGKIEAGLVDSTQVNYLLKQNKFYLRTLKDYTPEIYGNIGIAVKKNDISLLNALNEKIKEMKADGTLYAILRKYGLDKSNII